MDFLLPSYMGVNARRKARDVGPEQVRRAWDQPQKTVSATRGAQRISTTASKLKEQGGFHLAQLCYGVELQELSKSEVLRLQTWSDSQSVYLMLLVLERRKQNSGNRKANLRSCAGWLFAGRAWWFAWGREDEEARYRFVRLPRMLSSKRRRRMSACCYYSRLTQP